MRQPGDLLSPGLLRRVILKHRAVVLDGRAAPGCSNHQRIQRRLAMGCQYRVDHLGCGGFGLRGLAQVVGQRPTA